MAQQSIHLLYKVASGAGLCLLLAHASVCAQTGAAPVPAESVRPYLQVYPAIPAADPLAEPAPVPTAAHARNGYVRHWLDTVAARNQKIKFAPGYRIQVYLGQDRAAAMAAKETLYRNFAAYQIYLTYTSPNFKIVCGDFLARIQALQAAQQLTKFFKAPLVQPAQVRIRK